VLCDVYRAYVCVVLYVCRSVCSVVCMNVCACCVVCTERCVLYMEGGCVVCI
jgi:hypothetical protein